MTNYNTTADLASQELLASKLVELNSIAFAMGQEIVTYTDTELSALKDQVALLDPEQVTTAKINAFLEANDADGNNVIDALPSLISDLGLLTSRVTVLEGSQATQDAKIATLESRATTLESKVSGIEGDIAAQNVEIEALKLRTDNAGLSEAQVRSISQEEVRGGISAVANALNAIVFQGTPINYGYPITNTQV